MQTLSDLIQAPESEARNGKRDSDPTKVRVRIDKDVIYYGQNEEELSLFDPLKSRELPILN